MEDLLLPSGALRSLKGESSLGGLGAGLVSTEFRLLTT